MLWPTKSAHSKMHFSRILVPLTLAAGALAAPHAARAPATAVEARAPGVIQNVGQIVALIEKGLGITYVEDKIDEAFGGSIVSAYS